MPVIFKGGTSGNREDALPPVPSKGSAQPVLDTSYDKRSSNVHFQAEHQEAHADHYQAQTPDFMPEGGGHADPMAATHASSDIMDPGATTGGASLTNGEGTVFKGAPNAGTKGGPA